MSVPEGGPVEGDRAGETEASGASTQSVGGATFVRGQSYAEPRAPDPGFQRGASDRFRLVSKLGEGGMGEVWLAEDLDLRREVAIKRIRADRGGSTAHFFAEAQVSGQLEHPNIVPVHDLGFDEYGEPYLVLKRVEGKTLSHLLADIAEGGSATLLRDQAAAGDDDGSRVLGPLLRIFQKVCDGVAYAHARGVLHRDLKPGNIMVGRYGEVLVLDWGLAKVLESERNDLPEVRTDRRDRGDETQLGALIGTPSYMAPEQARGDTEALDERSDVYGLGAVLYQILTLRRPAGGSLEEIIEKVSVGDIVPPRQRAPDRLIPQELEDITRKAMARDKRARYASVEDLRRDVEAWLDGRLVAAHEYSLRQRLARWARRRRTPLLAGFLTVVLSLLALLGGIAWSEEAERTRRQAEVDARGAQLDSLGFELRSAVGQGRSAAVLDWLERRRGRLNALADDGFLAAHAPALAGEARQLAEAARAEARRLIFAEHAVAHAAIAADTSASRSARAAESFVRYGAWLGRAGYESLDVAGFAVPLVREALARDSLELAGRWVAEAYAAQPDSEGAARCVLALARQSIERRERVVALEQALLAYSAGESFALRAEALLVLARALLSFTDFVERTPFDRDVPTRHMALRCLLRLVAPDGSPRPALAALPEAQADALRREAWALLGYARQVAFRAFDEPVGLVAGGQDGVVFTTREGALVLERVLPAPPGDGPCARETVARFPLHHSYADRNFGWFVYAHEGGWGLVASEEDGACFVIDDLAAPRRDLGLQLSGALGQVQVGDLDGDGRVDLALTEREGYGAVILYRRADGIVVEPLRPRDAMLGAPADRPELRRELNFEGIVRALELADLDGDGQLEVAVVLGRRRSFSLEVWEVAGPGRHRLAALQRIGRSGLVVVEGEHGPLLRTFAVAPPDVRHGLAERGLPVPPVGLRLFAYDGERLQERPSAWSRRLAGSAAHDLATMRVDDGVLAALRFTEEEWRVLFPDEQVAPLDVAFSKLRATALPGIHEVDGLYRYGRDADLEGIEQGPIPELALPRDRDPFVRRCRFLRLSVLPREALRVAREGIARGSLGAETRRQLLCEQLHALSQLGASAELAALLEGLTPDPDLAADLVGVAGQLAAALGQPGRVSALLLRWRGWPGMPGYQRDLLFDEISRLNNMARNFAEPSLLWRGDTLRQGDLEVSLEEHLWVSSPTLLDVPGDGALRVRSVGFPGGLQFRLHNGSLVASRQSVERAFGGVHVVCGTGAWRLLVDLRITAAPEGSGMLLGFLPRGELNDARKRWPLTGCLLRAHGLSGVQQLLLRTVGSEGMGTALELTEEVGMRLRIDLRYDPYRSRAELTVADLARRKVVVSYVERMTSLGLPREALVGFGGDGTAALEAELEQIAVYGDIYLSDAKIIEERVGFESRDLYLSSMAQRAVLGGDHDAATSALAELAELYRGVPVRPLAGRESTALRAEVLLLEALWAGTRDRPEQGAAALAALVPELSPQAVGSWFTHRASGSLPDVVWTEVGKALAADRFPGVEARVVADHLGQAMRQAEPLTMTDAVIAAWVRTGMGPEIGPIVELAVLQYVRAGPWPPDRSAASRRYLEVHAAHPLIEKVQSQYRAELVDVLFALLRRHEALEELDAVEAEDRARYLFHTDLSAAVQAMRAGQRQHAWSRSRVFPRLDGSR